MVFRKKSTFRKKRTYKKKSLKISKAVRKYVKKAINGEAEKKQLITYAANQSITTAAAGTPGSIALMPVMGQGGASYQRIGSKINVVHSTVRGRVNVLTYNAGTNPKNPIIVKMWLVSNKDYLTTSNLGSTAISSDFFEINNGTAGLQGNTLDLLLPINKRTWSILATKEVKLGQTSPNNAINSVDIYNDNSPMSVPFYFNLTKHIGKTTYNENNTAPINKSLWLIFQPVFADGSTTGGYTTCEYHSVILHEYTDI